MNDILKKIIPKDNLSKGLIVIILVLLVFLFSQKGSSNTTELEGYNLKANELCKKLDNSTICVYEIELGDNDRNQCMYIMLDNKGEELFTNSLNCETIKKE